MATVLLVRHGRTTANAEGGLAGRSPVGLDEVGRGQAAALGLRLRAVPLAAVVTSPLPRCRQTVSLALPAPPVPVTVEERLTECGYGDWQGRPLAELAGDPLWPVVQQHPSAATFPGDGGESLAAMATRAVAAVREWDGKVTAAHGADAVWLACSHADVIKAVVADALGLHLDMFQRIVIDPGSLTAVRYTPTRPFLLRLGDTGGELRPPAASGAGSDAAVGGGAGSGAPAASGAGSDAAAGSGAAGSDATLAR